MAAFSIPASSGAVRLGYSRPWRYFMERSTRRSSPLSPALRSLVTVRVSQINHCAFWVDINSETLAKRGVAMDKIEALGAWRDSLLFSPVGRLALEYADAMTITAPGVSDDLRQRLMRHWNDDAIVELTGLIGFQNLSSKFNAALDVPSQGFCSLPSPASRNPSDDNR